jgi:pyruvate kinase
MPVPHPTRPPDYPTRAKIVATLGPASDSPEVIQRLIDAGVSAFRLNFSHGSLDDHARILAIVREVAEQSRHPIAVLGDLAGPKIRVGSVPRELAPAGGIELLPGQDVLLQRGLRQAHLQRETGAGPEGFEQLVAFLPITHEDVIDAIQPGERVLINDGAIRMLAVERTSAALRCRVTVGGLVTTGKGVNLPDSDLRVPAITQRDWECVEWAVNHGLDFLALSFVRRADEIRQLKQRLAGMCPARGQDQTEPGGVGMGAAIPVIAKIEKPQALENLDEIVDAADAIMVARGDLGVEMDIAQVPVAQKRIIACCQHHGKPCIVATQMLETMIEAAIPTRAEASDVANAVFDGADAVMLSAETAIGKHPALVVETMRRIIAAAEERVQQEEAQASPPEILVQSRYPTAALAHGAWHIAKDIGAKLVICWSQSGGTARYLSQNDFPAPIVAYSSSPTATRRMALLKNVTPILRQAPDRLGQFTDIAERDMLDRHWVHPQDPVVLLAGKPLGQVKSTNSIAILYINNPDSGYRSHQS